MSERNYERTYVGNMPYRLSDPTFAAGHTIAGLFSAGWTTETLIANGHLTPCPTPAPWAPTPPPARPLDCNVKVEVSTEKLCGAISEMLDVSAVTASLIQQIAARDAHGKEKYNKTLDRTDLSLEDWLQHQAEEQMDSAGYALAAKREAAKLIAIRDAAVALCNLVPPDSSTCEPEAVAALEALRATL